MSKDVLPEHVAIIMDGNGRWAKQRFLTRNMGHKAGAEALRKLAERMNDEGHKHLTVFAFSTENWDRPGEEVRGLMSLLRDYIQQYINDSKKNNMCIRVIGDITRLDSELQEKIAHLTELTKDYNGMNINIAINYGGRDEIVRAVKSVCEDISTGKLFLNNINNDVFSSYLDTRALPDPDLIIRTSGETRLSNFLLWQSAYAEFYISDKLWPDFTYDDLLEALKYFNSRERRYGTRR